MNNLDSKKTRELFSRLFVLGIDNKINFLAFTKSIEKSELVKIVEKGLYDDYLNKSLEEIFFDITGRTIDKDISYGVFNDAYWCGYMYFELHKKTHKSFAYIFLKFPLSKMIKAYPVYHEMDFSSLLDYYNVSDKEKTILRALCEEKGCSISKLSQEIGICKTTLSKYNASDESIYKASFQTVYKVACYFDVPFSLFVESLK